MKVNRDPLIRKQIIYPLFSGFRQAPNNNHAVRLSKKAKQKLQQYGAPVPVMRFLGKNTSLRGFPKFWILNGLGSLKYGSH